MAIEQILATSGALVTAVVIVVNALKALGLPGKTIPFFSILLGIGGAYLTISRDPAIFVIIGILVTASETAIFSLNANYFAKKEIEAGIIPPPAITPDAGEAGGPHPMEGYAEPDFITTKSSGAVEPTERKNTE